MLYLRAQSQETLPLIKILGFSPADEDLPAPEGFTWVSWVFINQHGQFVRKQPVLLMPRDLSGFEEHAIAPNEKYYYLSNTIRDDEIAFDIPTKTLGGWFWERGSPMPWRFKPALTSAMFSPDSRWLVGFNDEYPYEGVFYAVECRARKVRKLFTTKLNRFTVPLSYAVGGAYFGGWYPDSRHIWYVETDVLRDVLGAKKPLWHAPLFKVDIYTGKRRLLSLHERRRVYQDWNLLDSRYRYEFWSWSEIQVMRYSPNRQVRVRVEPVGSERGGVAKVVVEWRKGPSTLVVKPGDHDWQTVVPWDITNDGRWVLLGCNKVCPAGAKQSAYREIVLIEVPTGRRYVYIEAQCNAAESRLIPSGKGKDWGGYIVGGSTSRGK